MNTLDTYNIVFNIVIQKEVFYIMQRLRVVLEFSKSKPEDLELYSKLIRLSNPGATVKDILKGVLPLDTINIINKQQ